MTAFAKGDRVTVVEHNDATRQPRLGGREFPATVREVAGSYVSIVYDDRSLTPARYGPVLAGVWVAGVGWVVPVAVAGAVGRVALLTYDIV